MYIDASNLYGWAMGQYLRYSGFKWLNQKEISDCYWNSIIENSSIGYILEVDLEYPSELHDLHNDYPLRPEKLEISKNMLSNIANEYGIKFGGVNKLVPNLGNKSKYVVHYRNLHLYLSSGMKLVKVHRILKFKQSDWLKKYVDFNPDKMKNGANSSEKDFLNIATFVKTMENLRKRISVKLVNNAKDAKDYVRCISKPSFVSQKIFSKNFVAIHEIKPVLTRNKPIYVGFIILDLSKLLMYELIDAKLLLKDTDSLVYEIETKDVYEDFYQNKNLFDFSDYPLNSKFFTLVNKKVVDKMKHEFKGKK